MTCCTEMHKQFDKLANGELQIGEMPDWMPIKGRMAWYVYQGPYSQLGSKGFAEFWRKFNAAGLKMTEMGAPGDIYVCSPECHKQDDQARLLTIIWCPIK